MGLKIASSFCASVSCYLICRCAQKLEIVTSATVGPDHVGYVPHAPATPNLMSLMEKLGSIDQRHEDLVKRVDALEVSAQDSGYLVNVDTSGI